MNAMPNHAARATGVLGACGRFQAWVFGKVGPYLVWLAISCLLLATLLGAVGLTLAWRPDLDMARFLQGRESGAILDVWRGNFVWALAFFFLLVDAVVFVPAYGALFVAVARRLTRDAYDRSLPRYFACLAVALTVAGMLADELENLAGIAGLFGLHAVLSPWPSLAKSWLLVGAALVLAGLLAWRFFGVGLGHTLLGASRAELRRGVFDIVWRSRYNLIGVGLFAGLVLLMDQTRDVLVGVAQAFQTAQMLGAAAVLVLSAFTLWSLAYSAWLSTRIVCRLQRPANRTASMLFADPAQQSPPGISEFAKWWARLVGAAPVLILMTLCGAAAGDALRAGAVFSAWILLAFGALTLVGATLFLVGRGRKQKPAGEYYECTIDLLGAAGELDPNRYRFFGIRPALVMLPITALVALAAVRAIDLLNPAGAFTIPSPTFVIVCLGMTLWFGVAGLVSQLALLHGRPYMIGLLLVVAVLGWGGCTDNHVVWTAFGMRPTSGGLLWMWGYQALLACAAALAAYWAYRSTRKPYPADDLKAARRCHFKLAAIAGVALAAFAVILAAANFTVPRSLAGGREDALAARLSLDAALEQWLEKMCKSNPVCADTAALKKSDAALSAAAPHYVYFVSSEGGGIRAAYWSALVLLELSGRIDRFDERTFSVSGVSGGALGAAIYRACSASAAGSPERIACIQKFSELNLLGPLLSSLLFEDILARVLPTSACATPGCGILDRGAWFEQALESTWQDLRQPLSRSRSTLGAAHLPYLFLNSTWVETAERTIASDLSIDYRRFPTARDQLEAAGKDLPLSTAAHNAARFPYVNALGSIRRKEGECLHRQASDGSQRSTSCGHLADGGYFDNSGGHTTADVLRALGALLQREIPALEPLQTGWLRRNLVPQVIMVRNGVEAKLDEDPRCSTGEPDVPRCKGRFFLLTDLIGPLVTALNAIGTGSNGRLAEALLANTALSLRPRTPEWASIPPVVKIDLENDGVLYPLGWYLSVKARCGMERQARNNKDYGKLCHARDESCLQRASRAVLPDNQACGPD
ncbi:MAG: hypothetical protein ACXW2A_04640 [Burkholderiales bacterium]